MISTYDNVKLKPTKKVLNQMLRDYKDWVSHTTKKLEGELEGGLNIIEYAQSLGIENAAIIQSLETYWDVSKMTQRETEIIIAYIRKEREGKND